MTRRRPIRLLMVPILAVAALAESGCVLVPMKMTTRFEDSEGRMVTLPKGVIVRGTTTREEVAARFGSIEIESGVPGLYWGRARKSTWGLGFATVLPTVYAGGGRSWGIVNLLVTFDDRDRVTDYAIIGDPHLQAPLVRMVTAAAPPPLALSGTLRLEDLSGSTTRHDVELTPAVVTVTTTRYRSNVRRPSAAAIPLQVVRRVRIGEGGEDAGATKLEIRFSEKTMAGEKVTLAVTPRAAADLVRWLAQVRPDLLGPATR